MKIEQSSNGHLWYIMDSDNKIVKVAWSEELAKQLMKKLG